MKKIAMGVMSLLALCLFSVPAMAGILSTISGEAKVAPMEDGSGKYMLKSDGFYCLEESGALHNKAEIHYLDHFEMDGTVFHGFYYHDTDGLFRAGDPHLEQIKNLTAQVGHMEISEETGEELQVLEKKDFSGIFEIGNLGKMTGAPRVIYAENEKVGGTTLNGYYYLNENGRVVTNAVSLVNLKMTCNDRFFDGTYYFGGPNGTLVTAACTTKEGQQVDDNGKLVEPEDLGMDAILKQVRSMTASYKGKWSVYVKDLSSDEYISYNNREEGSASLIKLFVMMSTYRHMNQILKNEAARMKLQPEDPKVRAAVDKLLWNMITISDNESFNELVRLQTAKYDFKHGCRYLNVYLEEEGYKDTRVRHTLQPSGTKNDGIGESNTTSAKECGRLLESIYRGECVSEEASEAMLELLKNQHVTWKIRAGLPADTVCANKSGENSSFQHDVGIVFGSTTDYVICVLSEDYGNENTAFDEIRDISRMVYNYLNYWVQEEE
ncbi:MAG: serine hydrolase [Clostridiales bacterium]|nr:serine hydrolase [Candidatus Blautia equi]